MYHRTMWARSLVWCALALTACEDPELVHGCPSLTEPQAAPGDPVDGDTYPGFAAPLLQQYCTRCHATTLSGAARSGAPVGLDWDDEATVRQHLAAIRRAIGVRNFMPPSEPRPSCDERRRLVRWIDADAP